MFYAVLLLGMGVTKLWRRTRALVERRFQTFASDRPANDRPPRRIVPTNANHVEVVLGRRLLLRSNRETAVHHPQLPSGNGGGSASPSRDTGWPAVARLARGERSREPEPDPV